MGYIATPTPPEIRKATFVAKYTAALLAKARKLKADGTVAMSMENLFSITVRDLSRIPEAPVGTNCAWVVRQEFARIVEGNRTLRDFTTI